MKIPVLCIVSLIVLTTTAAKVHSSDIDDDGIVYNQSFNKNVSENIIEDLILLLDSDLAFLILSDYEEMQKRSAYNIPNNFFSYRPVTKKQFIEKIKGFDIDDESRAKQLITLSIKYTIETSMGVDTFDPMNKSLEKNIRWFTTKFNNGTYHINYTGHKVKTIEQAVDEIYNLKKISKDSVYPHLIIKLANLFNTLQSTKNININNFPVKIVRRFPDIQMEKKIYGDKDYASYRDCYDDVSNELGWKIRSQSNLAGILLTSVDVNNQAVRICAKKFDRKVVRSNRNNLPDPYKEHQERVKNQQDREMKHKIDDIHRKLQWGF